MVMPAEQSAQSQQQSPQANPMELVQGINDGMVQLLELMGQGQVPAETQQKFGQLVQGFRSFVENDLGAGGGEPPQEAPSSVGEFQGANPNAVPA